ncbi:hypothetical protein C0431_14615 [bacterium]|nr:hypothetical protein [bacterium]
MITVYGTLCLDRLHQVPKLPRPGGYVEIAQTEFTLGGEAFNTYFSLRNWNHPTKFIPNSIGTSPEATTINTLLHQLNFSLPLNFAPNQTTPVCDIYVTPDGERTMFGIGFATLGEFSNPKDIELISGDWFTADPNLGASSLRFGEAAAQRGLRRYFMDFPLYGQSKPNYLPTDIWQSSTDQFGTKGDLQANLTLIEEAHQQTNCFCILTDGKNGFVVCGSEQPATHYPPFRAENQIDSTGAGDCFRAGMLHQLDSGAPIPEALAFAAAAASLACQGLGATASIPTVQEVQHLIQSQPQTLLTYRQLG